METEVVDDYVNRFRLCEAVHIHIIIRCSHCGREADRSAWVA